MNIDFQYSKNIFNYIIEDRGRRGRDRMVHVQSVPIITKVMSSNPVHHEVYSIQHYVMKFVSNLREGLWFSPGTPVSSTNKTDLRDFSEILLEGPLNTINQTIIEDMLSGGRRHTFKR